MRQTIINEPALRGRFQKLTTGHMVEGSAFEPVLVERLAHGWFNVVYGLYAHPARAYHAIWHIADLLDRFDDLVTQAGAGSATEQEAGKIARAYPFEIETAIWFHDVVYVPGSRQNEDRSAELARMFLETCEADPVFTAAVETMIRATTHREWAYPVTGYDNAVALLCDLDLAGLAVEEGEFRRRNTLIRKEFAHVSDEQFRWGQTKFLADLMGRPALFYVLHDLEAPARRNIERYLCDLLDDRL